MGHAGRLALLERQVVAHSFFSEQALDGNPKELDDCDAQQAYALLTLLADPEERVALRCWCGFRSGTLNEAGWRRLRTYCEENGESPRSALEQLVEKTITIAHTGPIVERFKLLQAREAELSSIQELNISWSQCDGSVDGIGIILFRRSQMIGSRTSSPKLSREKIT